MAERAHVNFAGCDHVDRGGGMGIEIGQPGDKLWRDEHIIRERDAGEVEPGGLQLWLGLECIPVPASKIAANAA